MATSDVLANQISLLKEEYAGIFKAAVMASKGDEVAAILMLKRIVKDLERERAKVKAGE